MSDKCAASKACQHENKTRYAHFERQPERYEVWKPLGRPGALTAIRTECNECHEQWFDYTQTDTTL